MQIKDKDFSELYKKVLTNLMNNPDYVSKPRNMETKEICDAKIVLTNPISALYDNKRRGSQLKYISAEYLWYFNADRDIDYITKYAKFWEHISEDNKVNSSYGDLIFNNTNQYGYNQYQWAYDSLIKDKDSRQAIMHFNMPKHQYNNNKDFVCTLHGMFMIRNNKLNFSLSMRSNDAILGLPTDIAFFCLLQYQMYFHLKKIYPELELGTYTHTVHSLHIYERHYDLINEMLQQDFIPMNIPIIEEESQMIDSNGKCTEIAKELYDWSNTYNIEEPFESNNELIKFITTNIKN